MRFRAKVVACTTYTVEAEAESEAEFRSFVGETGPGDDGWVEETYDDEVWAVEEVKP